MKRTLLLHLLMAALGASLASAQPATLQAVFPGAPGLWTEKTLRSLSLEEKIGQLFMVPVFTSGTPYNLPQVERLVKNQKIGGVIFMKGGPGRQAQAVNLLQHTADLPLLVGIDGEWGPAMRLDSVASFPHNMTLGALVEDSLLFQFGKAIADQCRAVGVHVNFAPVVDVNNNANNPVINDRSFGEFKANVARKARLVMLGMQSRGVMACAKHFPGHGDTDTDSHLDLPLLKRSLQELDTLELYPFRQLIRDGVMATMVAHLYIPALDSSSNVPATMSHRVVSDLLRNKLGFKGLIFTDALNMKGVAKFFPPGRVELAALKAGNDVLLYPENVPLAIQVIKEAVFNGELTQDELDQHVRRILMAKEWLRLPQQQNLQLSTVQRAENAQPLVQLRRQLYQRSLTLVHNDHNLLPLKNSQAQRIAYVQVGEGGTALLDALRLYGPLDAYTFPLQAPQAQLRNFLAQLDAYTTVVVGLMGLSRAPARNYNLTPSTSDLICYLTKRGQQVVVAHFGNPYALQYLGGEQALLVAYEDQPEVQVAAAEAIFGGRAPSGHLPVTVPGRTYLAPAYPTLPTSFAQATPEEVRADPAALAAIDSVAMKYVRLKAMPGCAVLAMKGNRIFYAKGFGYTDYERTQRIDPYSTVYDLASITKVMATTLACMKLFEENRLDLQASIAEYLPELKGTEKEQVKITHLLQHTAGLPAFLPFWQQAVQGNIFNPAVLNHQLSDSFPLPIAPGVYLKRNYPIKLFRQILDVPLRSKPGEQVLYSDLGFILLGKIVERLVGKPLEWYVSEKFYTPLGMDHTLFTPALKCSPYVTPPTVEDGHFRFTRVAGYVNDETAALLGGVAGHAGLFSNTYDLAKVLLMLKNEGTYGGQKYFEPYTVKYFTSPRSEKSRRGLGWDKPEMQAGKVSPASTKATASAFGHLGFTGTCVWVDPGKDLIYIFLSNRTFPDPENHLFGDESVRIQIMDALYRSLEKGGLSVSKETSSLPTSYKSAN